MKATYSLISLIKETKKLGKVTGIKGITVS
jgi:hypothetical protein